MDMMDKYGRFVEHLGLAFAQLGFLKWFFLPVMLVVILPMALFIWIMSSIEFLQEM